MFRRNNKTRKYQAPAALVTHMALESNFCATVRFNVQVKDLENMNDPDDPLGISENAEEVFYFES
jgi:hypothetical protein